MSERDREAIRQAAVGVRAGFVGPQVPGEVRMIGENAALLLQVALCDFNRVADALELLAHAAQLREHREGHS